MLGGERGIRTPDRLLTYTRFPGVRLKPLIHLSGKTESIANSGRGSPLPRDRRAGRPARQKSVVIDSQTDRGLPCVR